MVTSSSPNDVQTIHCGVVVNAVGPTAGHLAKKLGVHLPVEPRKRCVFVLDCPGAPKRDEMPFVIDCTGTYVRPEGGCYIAGLSPDEVSMIRAIFEVQHMQVLTVTQTCQKLHPFFN